MVDYTTNLPVWETAAKDVLCVMYADTDARDKAFYDLKLRAAHFPPGAYQAFFRAMETLHQQGLDPQDNTVRELCGSAVSLDWLHQTVHLIDAERVHLFEQNAGLVRKYGLTNGAKQLFATASTQLDKGQSLDQVTNSLITVLMGLDKSTTVKRETAADLADDFATLMNSQPPPLLLTGLPWLDGLTGGMDKGHMWWIAAPYKSRKSTVMLNIALGLLMTWVTSGCVGEPPSIGIASAEMPRKRLSAQFVAMLAAAYIKQSGDWSAQVVKSTYSFPLNHISPTMLLQARQNYRRWDVRAVRAVDYGIAQLHQFDQALRVYDRSPEGGALSNVDTLITLMRRDIHRYNTSSFMIDFLQILKGADSGTLFEFMAYAAPKLQEFASVENVTLVVLAQQNEQTIKDGAGYSAGIKGGGDAAATADYLITSKYKAGDLTDDTELELTMKLSRHGSGGGDIQQVMEIHPPSGLLMDSQWIGRMQL